MRSDNTGQLPSLPETGFIISQAGARLCRTLRALRDPPSAALRVDHFRYHDTCAAVITPSQGLTTVVAP